MEQITWKTRQDEFWQIRDNEFWKQRKQRKNDMPGMLQPKREIVWAPNELSAMITVWPVTGGTPKSRILDITIDQYNNWQSGMNISRAFPQLSAEQREWLMSGIDGETWNRMFKDDEE